MHAHTHAHACTNSCVCTYTCTHVHTFTHTHTCTHKRKRKVFECSLPLITTNFCPPNRLVWSSYSASLLLTTESLRQENKWTMLHHALREHKAMDRRRLHRWAGVVGWNTHRSRKHLQPRVTKHHKLAMKMEKDRVKRRQDGPVCPLHSTKGQSSVFDWRCCVCKGRKKKRQLETKT